MGAIVTFVLLSFPPCRYWLFHANIGFGLIKRSHACGDPQIAKCIFSEVRHTSLLKSNSAIVFVASFVCETRGYLPVLMGILPLMFYCRFSLSHRIKCARHLINLSSTRSACALRVPQTLVCASVIV